MCDTFVALQNSTRDGSLIFGKNSDREPNEAQCVVTLPAADYPAGSMVKCTYIEIPQVSHTHAVLLSKPFWMWGAEMGSNAFGLTIGNEAVFTRVPYEKTGGLTGMDLLRLALERAVNADEGLKIITGLLETYGQGGNCGFAHPFYYHNSFLIADPKSAWILETVGKQWAAVRVKDVAAISNHLTIGENWDLCSDGLIDDAVERKFHKRGEVFNFRRAYSDWIYTTFSAAGNRNICTLDYLKNNLKKIDIPAAMSLLRNHIGGGPGWSPDKKITGTDVCMHAGFGPIRVNQTVGSLVSHITENSHTNWVTGTAAPCLSTFKPVWIDSGAPAAMTTESGKFDEKSLWWQHEILHRSVLKDYEGNLAVFTETRDKREKENISGASSMLAASTSRRREFSDNCVEKESSDLKSWITEINKTESGDRRVFYYRMAWEKFNREAGLKNIL